MRKFLLLLLLASTAVPAAAAKPDDDNDRPNFRGPRAERSEPRAERSESGSERSESRPERADRGDRPERNFGGGGDRPRSDRANGNPPRAVFVRPDRKDRNDRDAAVSRPERIVEQPNVRGPVERVVGRRPAGDTVREWRRSERSDSSPSSIEDRNLRRAPSTDRSGDLVARRGSTPRVFDPNNGPRRISRTPQFGTEPPPPSTFNRDRQSDHRRWRGDWRRDDRYDWRDWRRRHRSNFHFGVYLDPFGWDYARYGIGWRLWPSYYSSRFWLNDTWQYRLPPAYGPYRWVRYYDDALLVNIYTGEVVDVEYNFFW